MYKLFTLAAAIAVLPLPKNFTSIATTDATAVVKYTPDFFFPVKKGDPGNLFETKKNISGKAWSENWEQDAQENIRKSEYQFSWDEKTKTYITPNRKNNLRFFYTGKGFTAEPRTTKISIGAYDPSLRPDQVQYKTIANWKVAFNLDKKQIRNGKWQIVNNKADYISDKLTVQYINNDEGMRQNFILNAPLAAKNIQKINFSVQTKLKTRLNGNRLQFFHHKKNVLNYQDLKVWDGNGKQLEAAFKKISKNKYCIKVNTEGAVYPITVDPLSTVPAAILDSNQPNAQMGTSVSSAGDVNGDGYSDVIVGAPYYDHPEVDEGAAFVFHGSATGISTTAATTLELNQAGALLGRSVAGAGDVNGDGYSDVIVGAPLYSNPEVAEGAAFIYHGSATGISAIATTIVESNQSNAWFGWWVAGAGNVNGDAYSDVIVGAPNYDHPEVDEGAAFVYHGSAAGISTTVAAMVESDQANAFFGRAVASAGDVNGDGYSDIIVGAWAYDHPEVDEGAAFVYLGSATGINIIPVAMVESNQSLAGFGISVASAGDMNGDGYGDVIVGAYLYDHGQFEEGIAEIYYGTATGINIATPTMVESNQVSSRFGAAVACAGDVNGDGYSDVIIGAYFYDHGEPDEGAAFLFLGSATGINTTYTTILESNQAAGGGPLFGITVASAGDVNGDGYSDVIVGAWLYDNPEIDEGAAFVYHGGPNGLSAAQTRILSPASQDQAGIGNAVAGAGDVNGDGYSDVIIGAASYDNGASADEGRAWVYYGHATGLSATPDVTLDDANQAGAAFGYSVANAGDVNGDGYSDVIVGAYNYSAGNANEGRAWVHYGGPAGLPVAASVTLDDANQDNARFGISASSAGDVNGDGYSDVIVGAYLYDDPSPAHTDEGRAWVYYGASTGLSIVPASILDDADQTSAFFGGNVANAGDVNGDGYSDVIVAATGYDDGANANEGVAFIYFGHATTGLSATPDQMLDDANVAGVGFGSRVASAGDVNGDGFADVVVTSILWDGEKGRGWVYYGHNLTGLSATPDVILDNTSGNPLDRMGYGVSTAGDVNGDGYSDVIIGIPQHNVSFPEDGQAYIYYGSAAGLSNTLGMILHDATETHEFFGLAVACAGDINGDGYSDVVIGADHGSWTSPIGGRAYVHNGNDSITNKRNNLLLYNTDLVTPINSTNFIFSNCGAGLFAKSFLGRAKGKLVWETRLNYNAYSGPPTYPITNSTFSTSEQGGYTDLGLTGTELKAVVNKLGPSGLYTKLRARVKYSLVTAITGQVYGPWRYVSSIIDGNKLGALPIELVSFKAAWLQKGKSAVLDFTTDKESGICCFDIEKSTDGVNFYSIATLTAKNTGSLQQYSFTDNNATAKKQFYRLKIKGTNGKTELSNLQLLQDNTATEIFVFPNPTTDALQLQLNGNYDKMNVKIVNTAGQTVKLISNLTVSGQTLKIPVSNLPAGNYWLYLQSGTEKQVLQFVKQ